MPLIQPLLLQGLNLCRSGASGAPHSRWQPASSSTISMAAALGSYLAVCSGSTVQMLDLNPQFGQVNIVQVFEFLQQVSAVSLFQTGKGPDQVSLPVQHAPCCCSSVGNTLWSMENPSLRATPQLYIISQQQLTKKQLDACRVKHQVLMSD